MECSNGEGWKATSVFFTSMRNIEDVSGSLRQAVLDHGLRVEEDGSSASGVGCHYVTQHVVIPELDVGVAISGVGGTDPSALALAREIVASATPAASTQSS